MSEAEWRAILAEHVEKGPHLQKSEGAARDVSAIVAALTKLDALQETAAMQADLIAVQAEMIRSMTEILTRTRKAA